jgi:outer membrane protein
MKTKLLVTLLLGTIACTGYAQGLKIGYADANYILSLLPESEQVQADLSSHEQMIQKQLQAKYTDYQEKLANYQENAATMDESLRRVEEDELIALQESIRNFEQEAQNSIVKKQNQLLQPLFKKIGDAIKKVAEENNFDFIFSAGTQGVDVLLYAKEERNVTNMVLEELGITPPTEE